MSSENNTAQHIANPLLTSASVPQTVKNIAVMLENKSSYVGDSRYFNSEGKLHADVALRSVGLMAGGLKGDDKTSTEKKTELFNSYTDLLVKSVPKSGRSKLRKQIAGSKEYLGFDNNTPS